MLRQFPVVGLIGARQVGKTTLARELAVGWKGGATWFDLENERDLAHLAEPLAALEPLTGLVVLDEVQHRPELFASLRVLADRVGPPARFLVLGSASPELLRQSSESLAGRIAYLELDGLSLDEAGTSSLRRLWLRGGFPPAFLARDEVDSVRWREAFVRTYLERDLSVLGVGLPPATMRRYWTMLAHWHGQVWNAAELARSFGVSEKTVKRYLDVLCSTFMARRLAPWHENLSKRQVKAPKVYLADSGLLHALLGIADERDLLGHPKVGASWEGFVIDQLLAHLGARQDEAYFWGLHSGAELDLLVVSGRRRLGFEVKFTEAPGITPSMRSAVENLRLERLDVLHAGGDTFPMGEGIRAVALARMARDVVPLRRSAT